MPLLYLKKSTVNKKMHRQFTNYLTRDCEFCQILCANADFRTKNEFSFLNNKTANHKNLPKKPEIIAFAATYISLSGLPFSKLV